jgi:hypothetical protein
VTKFVLGELNVAFTVGMSDANHMKTPMPFMAVAPAHKIIEALNLKDTSASITGEDVSEVVDAFNQAGTVMFFDTLGAAETALEMLGAMLDRACSTEWVTRSGSEITRGKMQ